MFQLVGESVDEITTSCSNDEPTNSYTASQINSSNDTTSLVDYATPGDTSLTEKSCCGVFEDQDCINASDNSLTSTSSVLKRSVSERPCPTSYDRAESKRIKLGRSFSWQDPITGRGSCSTLSYKETEIETSKQDNGEENNAYILDNTSNEEARMDKVNLTSPLVSVQATCSNPVANTSFQREMFAPRWIPPQIFQQFAFHSLAPYANPRWLQLYRQNAEVPSMESVFRQPFDTNLLKRVYANTAPDHRANITTASQFDNYQVTSTHCDKPSASVQYGQVASTSCNNPPVNVYYNQGVDTLRSESEDIPIS